MVKIVPSPLRPGDTIALVAPASYMAKLNMEACIETLTQWGLIVRCGPTVNSTSEIYFSGSDEERRRDLQTMIDDPSVKAIMFARGGYGCSRIVDQLNWTALQTHPKWIIGFSDVTIFHLHLLQHLQLATIHGPMTAAFQPGKSDEFSIPSLQQALFEKKYVYEVPAHTQNVLGTAHGPLIGGNLSLLVHAIGTTSFPTLKGAILFVEEVGEYDYSVDRMFTQLLRSGLLAQLNGLIIGSFSDRKDTPRPFSVHPDQAIQEIVLEKVKQYGYPVCFDFPVGHAEANRALKCGMVHQLQITPQNVKLSLQ